jgi:hypothetical protein
MLLGLLASAAVAVASPLAPVPADTPVSAYGGHVVWSEQNPDTTWSLVDWHDGVRTTLPVPTREDAFDADVGPDAEGRPTVTYSRCPIDVTKPCSLRALTLSRPGAAERRIPVPRTAGASDVRPSVWRDRLVFARRINGGFVPELMLYDFATHRLTTLRHGTVTRGGITNVDEVDLGAKTVAFSWRLMGTNVIGTGTGWELRAERLADRRMVLAGSGYVSGACGGRRTLSPNATAGGVVFLSLMNHCGTPEGTVTSATFASGGLLSRTEDVGGGTATRIARDAATGATYAVAGGQLVRVSGLALQPSGKHAHPPLV